MTKSEWEYFSAFRENFREKCHEWLEEYSSVLKPLQIQAYQNDGVPEYPLQTPVVYNTVLDSFTKNSDIKLIVIGDNPGKDEQLEKNRSYLVGQSGKIAEGFFRKNPELEIDFRKNVIILNKTPVHTAKTKELRFLGRQDERLSDLIMTSQLWMAEQTYALQNALKCPVWIVGYAEIKDKGIFEPWRKKLEELYTNNLTNTDTLKYDKNYDNLFVFQHFSMNRFLIDLKEAEKNMTGCTHGQKNIEGCWRNQHQLASELSPKKNMTPTLQETLTYLGRCHKLELFSVPSSNMT